MSYDVWLEADLGGPQPVTVGHLDANYTYNCGGMLFEAVGLSLRDLSGTAAGEVAASLRKAIAVMVAEPARFEAMNPSNGWGSAIGWREFLRTIAEACEEAPAAVLRVG